MTEMRLSAPPPKKKKKKKKKHIQSFSMFMQCNVYIRSILVNHVQHTKAKSHGY